MFGNHELKKALEIALQKTFETGQQHKVFPAEDEPGKYTIGVPVKASSIEDILKGIKPF